MGRYIKDGWIVEGDLSCITIRRITEVWHSIPDEECDRSKRIPIILKWISSSPRIPVELPLGTGLVTLGGMVFNMDLLPEIPERRCEFSLWRGWPGILILHFPDRHICLAKRTDEPLRDSLGRVC
jgi:hypothetical protein